MNGEERGLVLLLVPRLGAGTSVCFVYSGSTVTPLARLVRRNHGNEGHSVPYCFKNGPPASSWALAQKE